MYRIALKMLMGDRAKYLILISAISFSSLLMTHQGSIFGGLLQWSTSTLRNINAPLWVMDPLIEQAGEYIPLLDTDLQRVRSVKEVKWAAPLYSAVEMGRQQGGAFKPLLLMGLDTATLIGAPQTIVQGALLDIWQDRGVVIDELAAERLSDDKQVPLTVGDVFEINEQEVKVVAVCKAHKSFFGYPYVYTTFDRAKLLSPNRKRSITFILAAPMKGLENRDVAKIITAKTHLKALTEEEFMHSTIMWVCKNTGIPVSFSITIIMGFLVGVAVSGQTFYSFVLENLKYLAALKAMGLKQSLLCKMLILQALTVGFLGFGIGAGLTSVFGHMALHKQKFPFHMTSYAVIGTFCAIMTICLFSAILGILKVRKLDASEVFRG
ncbi:ABC transporter permease [Rhabdochlamydiaceae symbiont of Dictyostelium giganteum]